MWRRHKGAGRSGRKRRKRERRKTKSMYNVVVNTIGMEPGATLAYDPGLEHHHSIMSTIGGNGGRLYIERVIYKG